MSPWTYWLLSYSNTTLHIDSQTRSSNGIIKDFPVVCSGMHCGSLNWLWHRSQSGMFLLNEKFIRVVNIGYTLPNCQEILSRWRSMKATAHTRWALYVYDDEPYSPWLFRWSGAQNPPDSIRSFCMLSVFIFTYDLEFTIWSLVTQISHKWLEFLLSNPIFLILSSMEVRRKILQLPVLLSMSRNRIRRSCPWYPWSGSQERS